MRKTLQERVEELAAEAVGHAAAVTIDRDVSGHYVIVWNAKGDPVTKVSGMPTRIAALKCMRAKLDVMIAERAQ